jgi:hypothetical protein
MDHEFVDLSMISAKPKIEQPVAPKDPGTHLRARRYGGAPIAPFARPLAPLPCWRPRRGESRAPCYRLLPPPAAIAAPLLFLPDAPA